MSDFTGETDRNASEREESNGNAADAADSDEVDLSVLLDFDEDASDDEPDLIVELIDLYLADVPKQLAAMCDAVSRADEVSLKRAAHTLKGSSSNLGANRIAALCEELEKTEKTEKIDSSEPFQTASVLIDRLDRAFARTSRIFLTEREKRV